MKKFIFLIIFKSLLTLNAEVVYEPFNFLRTSVETVKWEPEEGIYDNSIYLILHSDYGKIYYLINSTLSNAEPIEYKNEIFLKGKELDIIDYEITVILEKENNNIEIFSRKYRIDMTKKFQKGYYKKIDYLKRKIIDQNIKSDKFKARYEFYSNNYSINILKNEFILPLDVKNNSINVQNIELDRKLYDDSVYLVSLSYEKEGKTYTEVHGYNFASKRIKPPSFGSLYWGQVYKQSYKIKIKPYNPDDVVYYWLREWKSEDLIVGPPSQNKFELWQIYNEPVELLSKYGKEGIFGIAAYAMGKEGEYSDIEGPFYFKAVDIDTALEQTFENGYKEEKLKDKATEKKVYINDQEFLDKNYTFEGSAVVRFDAFESSEKFYFDFNSIDKEGKSELLPCINQYSFKNNDLYPVEFNIYHSNGQKIGSFLIYSEKMILPVSKKYLGNYISLNTDSEFEFIMPLNKVRYEIIHDEKKIITVTDKSPEFNGILKISANANEEKIYKIKFAAFDENDNLIGLSDDYYFKIDKKIPNMDVSSEGVDFNTIHNEKQIIKFIHPEKTGKIYYRFSKDNDWLLYESPIVLYPPQSSEFKISIYTKFSDDSGNEKERNEPFIILFDTRGLFVDSTRKFSGNGTKDFPFNSLERAIDASRIKNIKIIYILNDKLTVALPLEIANDVIIQPFDDGKIPEISFETKALWRKKYYWLNVNKKGYLELRNLHINIISGNNLIAMDNSKVKLYNLRINNSGIDDFCLFKNNKGKLGVNNMNFSCNNFPENFCFLNSSSSSNILKNIQINVKAKNILLFDIINAETLNCDNIMINIDALKKVQIAKIDSSIITFNNIIYKQKGEYIESLLYDLNSTNFIINESDFLVQSTKSFKVQLLEGKNSIVKVTKSLFQTDKTSSFIGFNSVDGELHFEQSMVKAENISDFSYNFRGVKSKIIFNTSIVYNKNCSTSVNFLLDQCTFEGANNSVFNHNIKNKAFSFWITYFSSLTSVNSLYFFDKFEKNNAFIYLNNIDYDAFKPIWYSNVVSSNIILKENLNKKDADYIIKDFVEKNVYYNFENDFNLNDKDFFIPQTDSPLLQGGITEIVSPIKIPEKDFFGKNRIISGIGIDIGAVQKSGNF
ncbi:MAG: hypothetical protein JXB50_02585 [Spirochaetes bacterium]|nr:hypothetical protein [Spirochaetota bacterium]